MDRTLRIAKYVWAGPWSLVGLGFGLLATLGGADWRVRSGAMEFDGGIFGRALSRLPQPVAFSAITLGHVILAVDRPAMSMLRQHEHVHVRQYERWGPLFVPAYVLSSLVQLFLGRDPYRENRFEREAFAATPHKRYSDSGYYDSRYLDSRFFESRLTELPSSESKSRQG